MPDSDKWCVYCDDEMPGLVHARLPRTVKLHGTWGTCMKDREYLHAIGDAAIEQCQTLEHIDWEAL
jgi:hypothetical protein